MEGHKQPEDHKSSGPPAEAGAVGFPVCESTVTGRAFEVPDWREYHRRNETPLKGRADLMGARDDYGIRNFRRCGACGFLFASPYPETALLESFYDDYFASPSLAAKKDKKIARASRRIRRLLRTGDYKTFLDVGCNVGTAVEAARLNGLAATGIDIDAVGVATASRLFPSNRFEAATADEFADRGDRFDLIFTCEVIEHLTDVHGFAAALARLLAPGGVIFLTTPDIGHIRVPRNTLSFHEVKPPEHLSLFTKAALRTLFADHGLPAIRFQTNVKPGIKAIISR